MTLATSPKLTLTEYLAYDDGTDALYELVDGVLVEMGAENPLNPQIAMALVFAFADLGYPRQLLVIGHQLQVSRETAWQPDLVVHSLESDAAMTGKKVLLVGATPPRLVVEVVSNSKSDPASRKRDYEEKVAEYAARGIGEYWI
ncbi:MAG: Uma2 family endonuclease [Cyanobacteria bacterium P01_A01_bin.105]